MTDGVGKSRSALDRDDGFTLVEVLVVLALVAIIFGILSTMYTSATRTVSRLEDFEQSKRLYAANRYIRDIVERAFTRQQGNSIGSSAASVDFVGQRYEIRVLSNLAGLTTYGGLHRITFRMARPEDKTGATNALLVAIKPLRPDKEEFGDDAARVRILLQHVLSLRFMYFGEPAQGGPPAWHSVWANRFDLPRLISVQVEMADGSGLKWPETVVQVHHR